MDKIVWDKKYSVGNAEIDEQHKKLFEILNRCAVAEKRSSSKYLVIVRELLNYCQEHFRLEEQLMLEVNYPDMASHVAEHKKILNAVETLVEKLYAGEQIDSDVIDRFVASWVKKHIITKDLPLKKYL
ncbi:bacteriohemerythrin [Maridesulfovibrio sp.]|uniref:bacteriohemerythrin n=1 Tax=unclassified Maridesulfovibrio TaxID=2794999 RepID=UPI003AFF73AA